MMTKHDKTMENLREICEYVYDFYRDHTDAQIESQIKRYDSTAAAFRRTADRNWARAVNGGDSACYGIAKRFYRKAAENEVKADALRGLLEMRSSEAVPPVLEKIPPVKKTPAAGKKGTHPTGSAANRVCAGAGRSGLIGAAVAGGMALVRGLANGEQAEEIAENVATDAVVGGAASAAAHVAAVGASLAVKSVAAGSALASSAVLPAVGAVAAAAAVSDLTCRVGSEFVDGLKTGIHYGGLVLGFKFGAQQVGEELSHMVEETREGISDCCGQIDRSVRSFFDGVSTLFA